MKKTKLCLTARAGRVSLFLGIFLGIALSCGPHLLAATITVTNTSDTTSIGDGVSLREAILSINGGTNLNADVVAQGVYGTNDTILFNIPAAGLHTITPNSALPEITSPLVLDGYSQPETHPNTLFTTDDAVILIELDGSNLTGSVDGIAVTSGRCTVRGLAINGFPGNGVSLQVKGGNRVSGNFVGTDASGTVGKPNVGQGIFVSTSGNTIGGTSPADRNVVAGNLGDGIYFFYPSGGGNLVQGNFIGTDATGTIKLGNRNGVYIGEVSVNTIGGPVSSPGTPPGNLISGNGVAGIQAVVVSGGATARSVVQGNLIGTDATGENALGNRGDGILLNGARLTTIGGSSAVLRNVISGNMNGVHITMQGLSPSFSNVVQGNYIGTDISGTIPLGNTASGVLLDGTSMNLVGGPLPSQGNLISGNNSNGVEFNSFIRSPTQNRIVGNRIGTDASGVLPIPNAGFGVSIFAGQDNAIGEPGAGNIVAFNGSAGVHTAPYGNSIRGNSTFSNAGPGIDNGLGPNTSCGEYNTPVLSAATGGGLRSRVQGTLNSNALSPHVVDFYASRDCDPSGYGEGERYLGSVLLQTDSSCNATFDVYLVGATLGGEVVTATHTDEFNSTSGFSDCVPVQGLSYSSVAPCRVADTRGPVGLEGGPALVANSDRAFPIAGRCGIPSTAQAVAFNFAVTAPSAAGFLRVSPGGSGAVSTATLNYGGGQTRANNSILALGVAGDVSVHVGQATGTVDLVIDITGYFQ